MAAIGREQAEPDDDAADVLFRSVLADHQLLGDAGVGALFGHRAEHVAGLWLARTLIRRAIPG
ncbi:MAG: hypothetical protein ACLQDY_25145 [Streptosporangiaceae bacterium]